MISESYSGKEPYHRPYLMRTLPGTDFKDRRWVDPVPFDTESEYGLALAHTAGYVWAASAFGVWRAPLTVQSLELDEDVTALEMEAEREGGGITVELRNDQGQYAAPGSGTLTALEAGCRLEYSPGYRTTEGKEYSEGLHYVIEGFEHTSAGGKAGLIIYAMDGWGVLESWTARYQLRWNKAYSWGEPAEEASVKEILKQVLTRAGLYLEVKSESGEISGYNPDFTIHAGDSGKEAVRRLLSFVPDVLVMEGDTAWLVNPQAGDEAVYTYGASHAVLEGRYRKDAWQINRVQVEGFIPKLYYPDEGEAVMAEASNAEEVRRMSDRLLRVEDRNINSYALAEGRAAACLRQAEREAVSGYVRTPVNCGQQLYDVVEITDSRAGLTGEKRRVMSIRVNYKPRGGIFEQKLGLGGV
jgi:hypothetical protein